MNVKQIVKQYLTENGYDGLYWYACGCRKGDLFPCDANPDRCKPGYIKWVKDEFGNKEWTIVPKKEEKP
jgi:hypothetical protein